MKEGEGDVIEVWSYRSDTSVLLMTLRWSSFGRHSTYSQDGACAHYTGVVPWFGTAALLLVTRNEVRRRPFVLYACILISSNPCRLNYNTTDHSETSQRVDEWCTCGRKQERAHAWVMVREVDEELGLVERFMARRWVRIPFS